MKSWSEISKRERSGVGLCIALMALCLCLPYIHGCGTVNPGAGAPIINPATGLPATNTAGQPLLQPAFVPNATGTKIVAYANEAAPLIPAPWGDILTGVGAIATIVMGGIAKQQSNKAATAATTAQAATQTANTNGAMLNAVIQGVETGTAAPTVTAASVKSAIQARATAAGVQPQLDTAVQAAT